MTTAISHTHFWNFWAKVRKTPHCWEWLGRSWDKGHPRVWDPISKKNTTASRLAFILTNGRAPKGQAIKTCQVKWCVNPSHIVDAPREKIGIAMRRAGVCRWPRRKVCRNGKHKMTPENSKRVGNQIRCRECYNKTRRAYWHRSLKFRRALRKH